LLAGYGQELVQIGELPHRLRHQKTKCRLRLDYMAEAVGLTAGRFRRPKLKILDSYRAEKIVLPRDCYRYAVLFPKSNYVNLTWPASYSNDLAYSLRNTGIYPVMMLEKAEPPFTPGEGAFAVRGNWHGPYPGPVMVGLQYEVMAAKIEGASIVVGNDSFGAHLAAAIGVPVLAIMGPTNGHVVFGHAPNVNVFTHDTGEVSCTGCHFGVDYRPACDVGCESLQSLRPAYVLWEIMEVLTTNLESSKESNLTRFVAKST
jgi:hypothetical protein